MMQEDIRKTELKKACINCGAELKYKPGTTSISCEYCGHEESIQMDETGFEELELMPYLQEMGAQKHSEEISMLHCKNCGANQHVEENYKSLHCVYCSMPLVVEDAYKEDWILPGAVLPFQIDSSKSHRIFQKWVKNLWFAPGKLKKAALDPQFTKGLYLPYWTFDAQLQASYFGQRGEYYYETRRVRNSQGKMVTQRVRKTRWYPASGQVSGFVDDTLIQASQQRKGRVPRKISRWNLKLLESFNSGFLSGFVTEKYTIPLKEGHLQSKEVARNIAERWCRQDIGGDTQRVTQMDMQLSNETFKHILLPVYVSAYRYKGKEYNFFINGENGAISGTRPYSFWKIFFTALFVIILVLVIVYFAQG
ncbi:DNA helicase PriA [Flagellimonas allohymeniacidonis]|uniref:DNA helicase PriA n=1 Tax=Flagellimonas allohymeniacidonis TaxID=2517819 RepID=A0A4V2HSE3_9FLAO|nr:DNA helicase PriA [Allomuricauda hymeniacidonis]TAI47420.1 DNA helicase PriA [Allomuricauda hymeniacidonis]